MTAIVPTETQAIRTARSSQRRGPVWWVKWFAMTFGLLIILIAAWQIAATISPTPEVPSPARIWTYFWSQFFGSGGRGLSARDAWFGHALPTMGRVLAGFVLGSAVGILLGILTGLSRLFRYTTSWVIDFLRAVPVVAVLPLFIVLLGGGDGMRVAFITYGISLYVLINAANGVASVDPTLVMMGQAFRLTRWQIITRIVLPAAQPQIWAGLRIATIGSLILGIVSEFFNATNGIGYQIQFTIGPFNMPGMWSWILLLALFGLAMNLTIEGIERRALRWHRQSH